MENTWLIQRLHAPRKMTGSPLDGLHNVFCFGVGGGRLTNEAWELLNPVWSFDYMGAAEYEFGAVPKALSKMVEAANEKKLVAFEFKVPRKKIEKHWRKDRTPHYYSWEIKKDPSKKNPKPVPELTEDPMVYVICINDQRDEIEKRLLELAKGKLRIRDHAMFPRALDPIDNFDKRTKGWLELDNGFFFSVDKVMFEGVKSLFGLNEKGK